MVLAVAQHVEHRGLALLVLQVGEQRGDGANGEAVDADDLVARPSGRRGRPGCRRQAAVTLIGVVCIFGTRPRPAPSRARTCRSCPLMARKSVVSVRLPSWTKEKGMVWFGFSAAWLRTSSQVGFSTLSKWTMVSPEWMPVFATAVWARCSP